MYMGLFSVSTENVDVSLLTKASHTVQQALSAEGFCQFQSKWILVVTWHNVSESTDSTDKYYAVGLQPDALLDIVSEMEMGHLSWPMTHGHYMYIISS